MKKLLTILALLATSSIFAQVPTNGLIGYWSFNGNANDNTGNGNNGTINGATLTTDRFGNTNNAYSFDGINDDFSATFPPINLSYTLSFWYITSSPSFGMNLFETSSSYCALANNQKLDFVQNTSTGNKFLTTQGTYSVGSWANVSVCFDGTANKQKIYFNGMLDTSQNTTGILTAISSLIMAKRPNNTGYFNGKLDDIRLYDRALDSLEILNVSNENICYTHITVTDTLIINTGLTSYVPVTYMNTIKVYPNPTNDHITVDYGNYANLNGYTLKITNSLGQTMFNTPITQQTSYIDLNGWSGTGIYFVHLINGTGNTTDIRKIVLQ